MKVGFDLFVLMPAVALWMKAKSFTTFINVNSSYVDKKNLDSDNTLFQIVSKGNEFKKEKISWHNIWQKYVALKEASDLVNHVHGNLTTLFLVCTLLYYAINIGKFFLQIHDPGLNILWTILYALMDILIFWLMVDIPNLVKISF